MGKKKKKGPSNFIMETTIFSVNSVWRPLNLQVYLDLPFLHKVNLYTNLNDSTQSWDLSLIQESGSLTLLYGQFSPSSRFQFNFRSIFIAWEVFGWT